MRLNFTDKFYNAITSEAKVEANSLLPGGLKKELGHFNVFNISELFENFEEKPEIPYASRVYYKIILIQGKSSVQYGDKVIQIEENALLFAAPETACYYISQDTNKQAGQFCVFTTDFFMKEKSGFDLDKTPIFQANEKLVFEITDEEANQIQQVFKKIQSEIHSSYTFKYDLIRNYVTELIHYGQKLQPAATLYCNYNSAARVTSLFLELLERQYPIDSMRQRLELKTAKDFADRLSIHVNHLNKVLKENTGKTTTEIISSRLIIEAKLLLKESDWNVSEIAYALGFDELSHFSHFFKKQTSVTALAFRK